MAGAAIPVRDPDIAADRKTRLLLVDDDPDNLVSLEATLQGLAEEIVAAHSGPEALRCLLDTDFAAILLDVKMPEMDGFETAELIRKRKRSRHTPILFLTGYRNDDHLFRGYDLGAVDFLFKPIVPEILRSKVAVFVELERNSKLLQQHADTLARAEQRFRSLLEAAPDAMLISAEDGRIVLVNTRTEELFGWSRDLLLGRSLKMLVPEWCHVGQMQGVELNALRRDGTVFPAEMMFSPLQTDDGLLITTVVRDITERKRTEDSIRKLNSELERRVELRTAELIRSNEALRQFAWATSHDLQEPLRMVSAYTQMLNRKCGSELPGDATLAMQYIVAGARRLEDLLSGLREYLQIAEAGELNLVAVDCNGVVKTALDNLTGAITDSSATVEYGSLPTVMATPIVLVQIFQNLISNAIKYRAENAPHVRIWVDHVDSDWLFGVADNGIGIHPRHHERVFGVFKRLHRDQYPGTGIGLAICKAAVERLGGRIWVESEPNAGATFRFSIPGAT